MPEFVPQSQPSPTLNLRSATGEDARVIATRFTMLLFASFLTTGSALTQEAGSIRHERFSVSPSGKVHLVVFDPSQYSLRVIDNGSQADRPKFTSLADAMQRSGCVAGINGGFFDAQQFTPCGLMIADGRTVSVFDPKGWQEGVLVVRAGEISLSERRAFTKRDAVTEGLQSSPWLVRAGRVEEIQKVDERRARRVFVGTSKSGLCAIGFSTPTTFYELAKFLVSKPVSDLVQLSEVLALDGASSAGFWCNIDGKVTSDAELTTVRNFVGVVRADKGARPTRKRLVFVAAGILIIAAAVVLFALRRRTFVVK